MPDPQIDQPSDELILQHLGAAVMLCWAKLPYPARNSILEQTGDIIGLQPRRYRLFAAQK